MLDDAPLLRRYVEEKSEEAFAELVRRYFDLVYSAALRQVGGDVFRAQDVAQVVFTTLARKAASLTRHPVLAGWLYTATQHAAAKAMRTEWRRRAREQEAQLMQEILSSDTPAVDWERVRPVLDDALRDLNDRDREAVLLRFFARRPFAEIGAALNLSEDTARMRVDRALDKLQALLAQRGVTSTAGALAVVLANQGALAAPAGLAASVTGAALAGVAGADVATGFLAFMSMNKTSAGVLAAIAGVLALNLVQQRANARLREESRTLAAEIRDLEPLRAENQRLAGEATALVATTADAAELGRLRTQVETLRKKISARRPYLWVGGRPVMPDMPPEEKLEILYREGRSSPMRSWQTMLSTGREDSYPLKYDEMMDVHALMFCFDEQARAKVSAFLATLSEEARAAFRSPERLVAPVFDRWLWKGDRPRQYGGGQGRERDTFVEGDPTRVYTYWRITYASGRTQTDRFPFKRFDDGWRYGPLNESDAEQMLALLDPATGQPKSPPPSRPGLPPVPR